VVEEDGVGLLQDAAAFDGDQAGIARPGAYKVNFHAGKLQHRTAGPGPKGAPSPPAKT
jgi:hypothetical protein